MPWQVPITVDGLEYPVTFNTEEQPTQQDLDEAVQQILSQRGQAPQPAGETPGYLSQLGSALGLGYRQMKSGVGATFNALTGDTADVAAEMAEMSKLQREQQAAQTPEDLEFMRSLEEAEKGFEQAQGPLESIGALAQYPAAVFAQPGAAFKTAVQSAPNALISGATSLAGYGLGGLVGGVAGIETGPGAILTGLAGATAGGALSNTLMEAGPSIFDVLNERTQGAASNMTADEIAAYLQQNPDIVDEGLKTGAIRGSVIGAVEALGVKGSGRLLTMPERAAARAVQKELMAQGVDVASKEAVDKALLDPALRASTKAVAETAKNQFSSAGNMARLVGASAIETGAAGAGELAAQAASGQDISTKEAFLEMMGEVALSLPMAATTKALEGAKYMLNPALVSDLGKASAENLAATGSTAAAEAQEGFNDAIELAMLPFTREDIRATEMPFTREDIRATELPFTREDIRATQLPFGREDIRATEMPFSREDIRGISTPAPAVEEVGDEVEPLSEGAERVITPEEESLAAKRRADLLSAAADVAKGKTKAQVSPAVTAMVTPQPVETQEDAAPEIPLEESLRQEPQDRVESREAEETGAGDQLLRPAEGEEEVGLARYEEAISAGLDKRTASGLGAAAELGAMARELQNLTPDELRAERVRNFSGDLERNPQGTLLGGNVRPTFFPDGGQEAILRSDKKGGYEVVAGGPIRPLPGEKSLPQVKKGKVLATYPSIESFVDAVYGAPQQITPPGEPTTATEGMVTPGGVATERDLTKPEQMNPEEFNKQWDELEDYAKKSERKGKLDPSQKDYIPVTKEEREALSRDWREFSRMRGYSASDIAKYAKWYKISGQEDQLLGAKNDTWRSPTNPNVRHKQHVELAISESRSVSAAAVDTYGIKLPEGYVKQGDLYVFQPQTKQAAAETQTKQPATKRTKPAKLDESKAIAEYPDLETIFEREVTPSGKKGGWVLKEKRTGARLSSGKTKEEASADFRKSLLWQQAWNEEYPSVFEMVNKLIEDKSINAEKYSQSYKVKPSKEEWLSILEGRLAELRQDREDTIKKNRSVGARPNTEFVDNFIANVEARLAKLQTTAAEKQTPVPLREGTGAAGVASSSLGGGRSPELTQVSTETETTSSEKLDPKLIEAERKQAKADKTAEKKRKKREEMRSKAIDSIIGASEKKKRKLGQVTNSDAIAAVAMLVSSKDVPGVLTTWTGTKDDFLRDPANQTADPEIYARIKAGELVEGFFNKGRAYVFLDGIGVSDEDMLRGEQMSVTPQVAAVRRVLLHESLVHRGIHGLPLRHRRLILNWVRQNSTPAELDELAKLYTEYANWRNSDYDFEALAEELLAKKVDSLTEIPKDGPMAKLMDILRQIWDFIVGYKREPTLSDLKSVIKLLKSGAEALANDRLKDGGEVKLSMIAPTAGITPEMDAEYMAAVEAGDMDKVQRMVDEAAKRAGYDVGPVEHGSNAQFDAFEKKPRSSDRSVSKGEAFHFTTQPRMAESYGKNVRSFFLKGNFIASTPAGVQFPSFYDPKTLKFIESETLGADVTPGETPDASTKRALQEMGYSGIFVRWETGTEYVVFSPEQIKSADPVTRDDSGNVIPLSQRFQTTSPDIRFSRPQFSSDTSAAISAGSEAARSTLYSERDMDIREAIRRAYEAMPKTNSVAVPIGELFAKTEELMPGVTQEEFSLVLQDLFEDNGAVLQEGDVVEPLTEQDRRYLALAEDEDANREELQRMVDEAAKDTGFNVGPVPHGTTAGPFNEFRVPAYFGSGASMYAQADSEIVSWKGPRTSVKSLQASQIEDGLDSVTGPQGFDFDELYAGKANGRFVSFGGDGIYRFDGVDEEGDFKYTLVENLTPVRDDSFNIVGVEEAPPPTEFPRIIQAYLRMDNPAKLGAREGSRLAKGPNGSWDQGLYDQLVAAGYDGVIADDDWGGPWNKHYIVFSPEQIKSADPVTRDDAGNVIPLSRRFDTGADIRGQINVTTPDGKRAGFVVVMPRAAKASRIKAEDATEAAKTFQADIIEAGKGRIDTASYQGNTLKSTEAPDHNENAPELYRDAAISLVDSLLSQGHSITDIADSFQDPEFRVAVGLLGNKAINPNVAQQAELFIGAEIQNRLENSFNKERNPDKKRIIEKTLKNHKAYYTTATGIGQNLNAVGALQQDPRFKWMFIFNEAEKEMADKAKEKLDTITGGGTQPVTDTVNQSEEAAADEATKQIEESVEEDEDAALFAEGEASLQGEAKSIWERMKDILRKIAFLDRLDKRDASSAKASLSEADKNTLSSLPKEERAKKRAEFVAEFIALGKIFMGEGKASDTPAQKATRQKRKKMVDTAKKRAESGKEIEVTRIQIQSFMDELMPGYTERKSIVNEVGDALLKAAEQRKAKPRQRTAIQDFVSAIKQTLMANIRGDKISAEQPSLGMLLAKTFAQQGSEAEAFAAAWANGRKKVRGMLAEMGVEEGNLDAELDAIMPPTPTLAYAPAAARKAVGNAMREVGLMRSDLLNDPAASKKAIMEKFDEAAKSANLTEEGWDKKGRALAEKAVDESIAEAKMAQERSKKVAKILSEQADKPVSLEEFGAKLAEFRFKKDKIAELFNRAKKLAERKIQMANDQAIRVLLAAENKLAQSAFFNAAEKPDTIVKAFREQVEEPMERDAFKKRMEKMLVTPEMADKLFDRAARERDNARWKKAQDLLEGPNALQNLLRQMNMARPGEQAPFSKQISWREILSQKAKTVEEYRQRIFDAISANEVFQNLSDEQKGRLSDLFSEAWESKRTDILDRMLEREIDRKRREGSLSEAAAKALQKSRNKIIELANLGGFDNDDLMKVLGEKFGIKTGFSEAEKARISELADKLQDETLNPAKRNKLAMEFAVTLAGASEIPVAEIIANWWTSSVLFGPQTIFSIGAAFVNGAYSITTIGTRRMLADLTRGDVKGAIEESILMLQGIAKYLGAFKQAGRRAWSYLWTGNVDVLGAAANDILGEINSLEELKRFKRHKLLAENLAKDPRALRRYVGMYLRFVNRLLTSLDAFNVMVTKAGTASLALRMSGMSTDNIIKAEKMLNLKAYKDQVIRDYFDNKAPTTQAEKALVDSYAEAEMYRAVDQLGGKMENADYLASESAMTMNPTGLGGFFYRSITGLDNKMKKAAEDYLEKAKKDWTTEKDLESTLFLGLAYLRQFAVQNLGGVAGYKFIRFASNKFNQGISYLPMVGLLRTLEAKGDDIKGKEAFIETIHRNQVIGAVLTLAAIAVVKALEDEPDDEERGNFWNGGWQNLTPDQKKQMLAKGQKEYTMGFKFNGRWYVFNYQNWPLNQVLAAIGSMSDQIRFSPKQWEEKGPLSKSLAGIVSGLKSTLEIPALSQLGTLVGNRLASKDPTEQTVDRLSNVAAGWVGGFVPRILKDLDFATQPELRKYKTLWEKTASHIPIYRRYVGEDYYDILGQPIKRNVIPGSREFMMGPTEPEYKILGALNSRNIFLTPANAEYRMVGKGRNRRRLTQEEADAYSLETGKGYRQMLLRYGQRALQMPTERARAFLSDKADEVRDRALKKVYRR